MSWPRPVPLTGDATAASERAAQPDSWKMGQAQRDAIYSVISARRDVRRFRPAPLPRDVVDAVLGAGHCAPSVGHSQPWRFIVVTSAATRERACLMARKERQRQANLLEDGSRRRMLDLQLDGIAEAPVGVVVCCDRRVPAAGVLGRATFPDADLWSCACAIENMWLAARAEGLGLGWVTLFGPDDLAGLVGLPPGVQTLGWLCLGWPDERPPSPALERAGWSRRMPLEDVVFKEKWPEGGPLPPVSHLRAPGPGAVVGARDQADRVLSTPGSLGALDQALDRVTAVGLRAGAKALLALVATDHPVAGLGVSVYSQDVTREVLEATLAGQSLGAAAARASGLQVVVINAGVAGEVPPEAISILPTGPRGDLATNDALSAPDVDFLLREGQQLGRRLAHQLKRPGEAGGPGMIALGEVGIGNTTVAAAMCCALLGMAPEETVGLGAGGDSATLACKLDVVRAALARSRARLGAAPSPLTVLAVLGGPEIAVMAGLVLGAASARAAVVLDGLATSVAALCAVRLEPGAAAYLVAGQRSRERAHGPALQELGLEALLDLRLRAGEGVGAVLAAQLLGTALQVRALAGKTDR